MAPAGCLGAWAKKIISFTFIACMIEGIKKTASSFTAQVLFFLIISYCFLGFSQNGYEGVLSQMMHGTFSGFEDFGIYGYMSHFITFRIYLWLGSHCSFIVWPVIIIIAMMLLSIIIFTRAFEKTICLPAIPQALLALVLVFFFIADSFFHLDMPAYAMLLCSLSLLSLYILDEKNASHRLLRWGAIGCFLWGMLTRVESTLPVMALILLWHMMCYKNIAATLRKFWPCIVLFAMLLIGLKIDFAYSHDYYKRLEPWAEPALTHQGGLVPLGQMTNAKDSMRHIAASQLIYNDTVQLHETFLRSILAYHDKSHSLLSLSSIKNIFETAHYNILAEIEKINPLLIWANFVFMLLLLYLASVHGQLLKASLYIACLAGGLFFIALISINDRYILLATNFGLLQLSTGLLLLVKEKIFSHKRPFTKVIITTLLLLCSATLFYENMQQSKAMQQSQTKKQQYYIELSKKYAQHILVLDINNIYLLPMPVFTPLQISPIKKILFHDAAHEMHLNHMRSYFQKQCQCNPYNWASVYTYFYQNKDAILFISTPQRIHLKQSFLQKVYGQSYLFKKENTPGFIASPADTLYCYKLQ